MFYLPKSKLAIPLHDEKMSILKYMLYRLQYPVKFVYVFLVHPVQQYNFSNQALERVSEL